MMSATLAILALFAAQDPDHGAEQRRAIPGYGSSSGAGVGSGYGTGHIAGTGYSAPYYNGFGYGFSWGGRPGFLFGYPGWGSVWAGYGNGGYSGGSPGYWGGEGRFYPPFAAAGVAGPAPQPPPPDRTPEAASQREINEGRRRFRQGDYRGAVDSFRSAVIATTESPTAQAWFAVGLIVSADGRNADKALRAAASGGLAPGALSLDGLFRDEKERVRVIVALAKVTGEGGLAASYALSLAGEPARLKQLSEKDPAALRLVPKP
jgi:hypothetical protein